MKPGKLDSIWDQVSGISLVIFILLMGIVCVLIMFKENQAVAPFCAAGCLIFISFYLYGSYILSLKYE